MTALAFCTQTASTKRNRALSGGMTGAAEEYLTSVAVTPLWPISPETSQANSINSPREFKECYHVPSSGTLPDIDEGDVLTLGGVDYPIFSVAEWTDIDGGIPCLQIVVQEVKTTWQTQAEQNGTPIGLLLALTTVD